MPRGCAGCWKKRDAMKLPALFKRFDYLVASGCTVLSSLITFVYNLYVKTYVMPYEFGIYTTANLVFIYLGYLQLGVLNAYNRDYPRVLGGGSAEEAERLRRTVFTYLLAVYLAVAVLGAAVCLLLVKLGAAGSLLGIGTALNCLIVGLSTLYNFFDNSAKSEGRVVFASGVWVFKTILLVLAGFFAVPRWGYWGMFAAVLLSSAVPFLFYLRRIAALRFSPDRTALWELMKTGAPLLVSAIIWTVMMSVDKFVILTFMTVTDLGVYSTALLGFSTLVLVPSSISQIFYIKMSRKFGETGSRAVLLDYADRFSHSVSLCTGAVSLCAYYGLPLLIHTFIPGYAGGIRAAQILVVGVSLYGTTMMYSNVFSILRLNARLVANSVLLCFLNFGFSTAFVLLFGRQIEHVACGTALSYALFSVFLVLTLGRTTGRSPIKMLANSWFPILCVLAPCLTFSRLLSSDIAAFLTSAATGGAALGLMEWLRVHRGRTAGKERL